MNINMFGEFLNMFGMEMGQQQFQQAAHQQDRSAGKAPPASRNALNSLPMVKVTADDLLEAANKECCVCLEEQKLGDQAVKLQCGHLFHKDCLVDWLKCQCTCPVCRFEIESDDYAYEEERKKRMKKRKLRFRIDELKSKSVLQLKELCRNLVVNIVGCIDKDEIIERLVNSGKIDITKGVPPVEISQEEFERKSVAELKHLLLSFGISSEGALEKSELRTRLIESRRIVLVGDTSSGAESSSSSSSSSSSQAQSYGDAARENRYSMDAYDTSHSHGKEKSCETNGDTYSSGFAQSTDTNYGSCHSGPNTPHNSCSSSSSPRQQGSESFTRSYLLSLPLSQLRTLCGKYSIRIDSCLYKSDIVDCISRSSNITIVPEVVVDDTEGRDDSTDRMDVDTGSYGASQESSGPNNGYVGSGDSKDVKDGDGLSKSSDDKYFSNSHAADNKQTPRNHSATAIGSSHEYQQDVCVKDETSHHKSDTCPSPQPTHPTAEEVTATSAEAKTSPRGNSNTNSSNSPKNSDSSGNGHYNVYENLSADPTRSDYQQCKSPSVSANEYYASAFSDSDRDRMAAATAALETHSSSSTGYSTSECKGGADTDTGTGSGSGGNSTGNSSSSSGASRDHFYVDDDSRFTLSMEVLRDMSVSELKSIMRSYNIDESGCLYRDDIIQRLKACKELNIIE